MKKINNYFISTFVLLGFMFLTACNPVVEPELLPVLTTTEVSVITQTFATSGGNITSDAGSSVTARGVCWSTKANPTIANSKTVDGAGIGTFTSSITGLTAGTKYFVRAYATSSVGTGYGGAYQITTFVATPNVTDIDGNVYHTITIGTQTWMVENLKTTKYNDGTAIPLVTNNTTWAALSTPAYCWYNNDATTYKNTYGALYNWYAVNIAKLAPTGWHMPTQTEWQTLEGVIGNDSIKNNSSGFSALLGGTRRDDGTFSFVGVAGYWWSSTEHFTGNTWMGSMGYSTNFLDMFFFYSKQYGFSVRCLRD